MEKVFYYSRMTEIFITKSSYDIDKKELFPVSFSSSIKVRSSPESDNEEVKKIDNDDP